MESSIGEPAAAYFLGNLVSYARRPLHRGVKDALGGMILGPKQEEREAPTLIPVKNAAAGQGECKDMGEDRPGMEFPYGAGSTFPYRPARNEVILLPSP